MDRALLPLVVSLLGCGAPREPVQSMPLESAPSVTASSAASAPPPVTASVPPVASSAPPAASSAPSTAAPPHPCDVITLGPCKVDYSARRTCLVADGYFSIDATADTPNQRAQYHACVKKVLSLPAGPKECTDAGTKCADAVSAQWFDKGGSAGGLPELCAVPPKCASVLGSSCVAAKKIIDDCYYAARKMKKP